MIGSENSSFPSHESDPADFASCAECRSVLRTCNECRKRKNNAAVHGHRRRICEERLLFLTERDTLKRERFRLIGELQEMRRLINAWARCLPEKCLHCGSSFRVVQPVDKAVGQLDEPTALEQRLRDSQELLNSLSRPRLKARRSSKGTRCARCVNEKTMCGSCQRLHRRREETARSRAKKEDNLRRCKVHLQWAVDQLTTQNGQIKFLRSMLEEMGIHQRRACYACGWAGPLNATGAMNSAKTVSPSQLAFAIQNAQCDLTPAEPVNTTDGRHSDYYSGDFPPSGHTAPGPSCGLIPSSGSSEFNVDRLDKLNRSHLKCGDETVPSPEVQWHASPATDVRSALYGKSASTLPADAVDAFQSSSNGAKCGRAELIRTGTGAGSKETTRGLVSNVWQYFTKHSTDDRGKFSLCNVCGQRLSGYSASNAKRHLRTVHHLEISDLPSSIGTSASQHRLLSPTGVRDSAPNNKSVVSVKERQEENRDCSKIWKMNQLSEKNKSMDVEMRDDTAKESSSTMPDDRQPELFPFSL